MYKEFCCIYDLVSYIRLILSFCGEYVPVVFHFLSRFSHNSLLCVPISPVVNLEMSSTARFFVEMQYMSARD